MLFGAYQTKANATKVETGYVSPYQRKVKITYNHFTSNNILRFFNRVCFTHSAKNNKNRTNLSHHVCLAKAELFTKLKHLFPNPHLKKLALLFFLSLGPFIIVPFPVFPIFMLWSAKFINFEI